ncbi:hypothetical protein QBF99_005407, partial [Citrobacter freundii]
SFLLFGSLNHPLLWQAFSKRRSPVGTALFAEFSDKKINTELIPKRYQIYRCKLWLLEGK